MCSSKGYIWIHPGHIWMSLYTKKLTHIKVPKSKGVCLILVHFLSMSTLKVMIANFGLIKSYLISKQRIKIKI